MAKSVNIFEHDEEILEREYEHATRMGDFYRADAVLSKLRRVQAAQAAQKSKVQPAPYKNPFEEPKSLADSYHHDRPHYPKFEDLNDANSVHNMGIEGVKNLWVARFGSGWVEDADTALALQEDKYFWEQVFFRLRRHLEKQQYALSDTALAWAWKLKEDDGNN